MACPTALCGKFSPFRLPSLDFSLEPDEMSISRQYCVSCTGFLSRDVLTSSRLCPARLLRRPTWLMIFIVTSDDRSFTAAGPRVCNSLPAQLYDKDIFYNSFRRQLLCRSVFTARCTLVQSAVLRSHAVCLSVCLSVMLADCDHIGWNSFN